MPRHQLILFSTLLIISITFLSLYEQTKLQLSTQLSSVVLFPVKTITEWLQYAAISRAHIEELETVVSKLRLENTELRKEILLDTTDFQTTDYILLQAQIIGRDPSNINGYLYVDKGQKQNIYVNQPVISTKGLVGKLEYVGTDYSIVETFENRGFAVSALDFNTGVHGIVKKKGNLIFDFINIDDEINIGDSIITSGMSKIFPEGIMIGRINKVGGGDDLFFKPVYITPAVQINRLVYVYILCGSKTNKEPKFIGIRQ